MNANERLLSVNVELKHRNAFLKLCSRKETSVIGVKVKIKLFSLISKKKTFIGC